jgi:acyl carrier protein
MTDRAEISARVKHVLSQVLDLPAGSIGPDVSASSSPAWTSLNHLMMISQLESEFGIVFTNQEIRELTSFNAILATLDNRLP